MAFLNFLGSPLSFARILLHMAMSSLCTWAKLFTIYAYFLLEILYAQYLFACLRTNLIEMNATGGEPLDSRPL